MAASIAGLLVLISLALLEAWVHRRRLRRIPVRIHVNGTRGKSTTTRLIAAGLRAGGYRVIAKTTGTLPRIILEDGSEIPVRRRGRATIREQMRTIALAARRGADAVVLECMAIHPELQWISERSIVRSTIGVITNVRLDHTETMGESREAVARCLALTIPREGILVSGEREHAPLFARVAAERGTRLLLAPESAELDSVAEGRPLPFPENTAMALAVCEAVGVDRALALAGMRDAALDTGALHLRRVQLEGKQVTFVNAFSLNDVDSLRSVWGRLERSGRLPRPWTTILNCRADRPVRSRAFGQILGGALAADRLILVGEGTRHAYRAAVRAGLDPRQILRWEGRPASAVLEAVTDRIEDDSTVIGAGNYHAAGAALTDLFARSVVHVP